MYIPLFPLKLVVFPGEELNLHIFEPRYKDLLLDIEQDKASFGIITFTDRLSGFGTEVVLEKVFKRYEDGRLDIKTRGQKPFRTLSFDNPMNGKSYAGGDVEYLNDDMRIPTPLQHEYVLYLKEMLHLLNFNPQIRLDTLTSYTFAHKVGLSLEEELELLKMESEKARTEFLIFHFKRMIPVLKAAEQARARIRQNGHFNHLDPLNF